MPGIGLEFIGMRLALHMDDYNLLLGSREIARLLNVLNNVFYALSWLFQNKFGTGVSEAQGKYLI